MHPLRFKEWIASQTSPQGAGEIWDSRSNADMEFGYKGARSKNVAPETKPGQVEFDPDEMFFGKKGKKRGIKLDKSDILGGSNYGSDQ